MMDIALVFSAANMVKSVGEYLGWIDSVSSDIKKLLSQPLNSAIASLTYVKTAPSIEKQKFYLKIALKDFIAATSLEENERCICAYVGLALCQYLLGEKANAKITLNKIQDIELSLKEKAKRIAYDSTFNDSGMINNPGSTYLFRGLKKISYACGFADHPVDWFPRLEERKIFFEEFKKKAMNVVFT